MDEQADIEAALVELADHGIDQKRHVVVDDFQHRGATLAGNRFEPDLGGAGLAFLQQRPRALGEVGKFVGRIALEILRYCKSEQLGHEIVGNVALAPCQDGGSRPDQRYARVVVAVMGSIASGHILDVHGDPSIRCDSSR